jgi:hypothetical protein
MDGGGCSAGDTAIVIKTYNLNIAEGRRRVDKTGRTGLPDASGPNLTLGARA